MASVGDLVRAALTELNVTSPPEDLPGGEALAALQALNRLVDSWATERLQIYTVTRTTWTIVSGTATYTVGVGGTVNVARPVYIDHVHYVDTATDPDTEYNTMQPLTDDAYSRIVLKALTSPLPANWYYNPTYPLGTLTLWPVPTSTTLQGVLYAPAAVAQFTSLAQTISLPPGYERMIVKNLALELAPSYTRQPDPLLFQQAGEAKANVKRANTRLMDLSFDAGALIGCTGPRWDIFVGP